ncbi:MAG TPA: calcium/sodium antiporter [Gemmatimonadales bacterium]|nr:calcium/sodium antiporter [Gemmatimonadales bacterium]
MTLLTASLLVLGGLALLAFGGELLVRGATAIAKLAGLTPAVIGLTVVALGTSLPELVVTILAAIEGQPDLAVGNVIGSNLANITFILGLTAVITPLPIVGGVVRREWPFLFLITVVCLLFVRDGLLSRLEAATFLTTLCLFVGYMVWLSRREVTAQEAEDLSEEVQARALPVVWRPAVVAVGVTVIGILMLIVGGKLLVDGAVVLAELAGMTPRVIGLTIVALGTSAPEIATSIVAALRRHTDMAVANLIGSNVMNTLGILGVAGAITPLPFSPELAGTDMLWMLAATILIFPLMRIGMRVTRWNGVVLLGFYAAYVWVVVGT